MNIYPIDCAARALPVLYGFCMTWTVRRRHPCSTIAGNACASRAVAQLLSPCTARVLAYYLSQILGVCI